MMFVIGSYQTHQHRTGSQTRAIDFERDKDGRWSIKIKKKATSDALLKPLVKKLLRLLGQ